MQNDGLNSLLHELEDEIDLKCNILNEEKKVHKQNKLFFWLCGLFISAPLLFLLFRINVLALFMPIIFFLAASFFALSSILFLENLGGYFHDKFI